MSNGCIDSGAKASSFTHVCFQLAFSATAAYLFAGPAAAKVVESDFGKTADGTPSSNTRSPIRRASW
jgi:hypothetical protein